LGVSENSYIIYNLYKINIAAR